MRGWVKRRKENGCFNNIVGEKATEDTASYKKIMSMSHAEFL